MSFFIIAGWFAIFFVAVILFCIGVAFNKHDEDLDEVKLSPAVPFIFIMVIFVVGFAAGRVYEDRHERWIEKMYKVVVCYEQNKPIVCDLLDED